MSACFSIAIKNKSLTFVIACVLVVFTGIPLTAAETEKSPQGEDWSSIAKLPDWGGLWEITFFRPAPGQNSGSPLFTPEYQAKLTAYEDASAKGEIQDTPAANCVPNGMPTIMTQPYPIEFLFTPGKVTVLIEAFNQFRQVFTDGRSHPDDPAATFNGHSIGHWQEDTLIIDTVAFVTDTSIGLSWGMRHSEEMRIVERIHTTGPDIMEISTTIYDPKALTKPWTSVRTYGRHRDWDLAEYICQQNNRNWMDEQGKAGINLQH